MPTPASARRRSLKKCQGQGGQLLQSFLNVKAGRTSQDYERFSGEDDKNTKQVRAQGQHSQTDETCRDHPRLTSEGLRQWEMHAHVDQVYDLVPFWQRGVYAAETGQALRLEEFLDKMEGNGGWRTVNDVLHEMMGGWEVPPPALDHDEGVWTCWSAGQRGGWGAPSTRIASDGTEESRRKGWSESSSEAKVSPGHTTVVQDGWGTSGQRARMVQAAWRNGSKREELQRDFVDAIARQGAVNEERRKQMHLFFELPSEQKIQKIEETIRFLRTHKV